MIFLARKIAVVLSLMIGLCLPIADATAQDSMNILFIAVDDLKPTMACYGDTMAITPNIDALAAEGMLFSHAYCQQAVCAPSRASLMTSRYPDQTKVWDLQTLMREVSPEITSLPEYLITQGFLTSATGKIFDYRSVDSNLDAPSWSRPYQKHYDAKYYDQQNGKPSFHYASAFSKDTIAKLKAKAIELGLNQSNYVKENYFPSVEAANVAYDGYVDGAILNVGIDLLDEVATQSKPFFLGVGFQRPHLPFVAPQEYWDLYNRDDFSLAPFQEKALNSPDIAYHNYDELRSYTDIPSNGSMTDEKQLELIHGYYAASSYVDDLVGMLLSHLESLGLSENTIIVLWGDHGWHLGDHNLWCKHSNFEEATRVPMIFKYPNQANKGAICEAPVEFTDIAPTLCELADVEIPQFFEGESLVPLFNNPDSSIRYGAFSQYPRWGGVMGYTLRTERYRLTKWMNSDGTENSRELYDYETDPLETKSLIYDPAYVTIMNEMDSVLSDRIIVPSTQTRIAFEINGVSKNNDTLLIENARVKFYNEEILSSKVGISTFTHLLGDYSFQCSAKGYANESGEISVSGDTLIKIFLLQEQYDVSFEVVQAWNGLPFSGATVSFDIESANTDELGKVTFTNILFGGYSILVNYADDKTQEFTDIEIFSDTTIVLALDEVVYNFDVLVRDYYSGMNLSLVDVSINSVSKITDYKGVVPFSEVEGNHDISISKDYYSTITDQIAITRDGEYSYSLEPTHNDAKIWIKNGASPLNGARVSIDTLEIVTDGLGLAKFQNLPIHVNYDYSVLRDGFVDTSGDFLLVQDTSIIVSLIETGIGDEKNFNTLRTWPTPLTDKLHLEFPEGDLNGSFMIVGVDGRVVLKQERINSSSRTINCNAWSTGIYYALYTTESKVYKSLIIKTS
jgi:iduronate 2-sulfatase